MNDVFYPVGTKFKSMQKNGEWKEVTLTVNLAGEFHLKFADGDITKAYTQEDLAMRVLRGTLMPLELGGETKVKSKQDLYCTCGGKNKREVVCATFKYWYCPDCKKEIV